MTEKAKPILQRLHRNLRRPIQHMGPLELLNDSMIKPESENKTLKDLNQMERAFNENFEGGNPQEG